MLTRQFAFSRLAASFSLARPWPNTPRLSSTVARHVEAQNVAPKSFVQKPATKPAYPERLLIYNAGTGKTAWIAFTKLGTIVFFAFGCLVIAPRLHAHPDFPWWAAPAAIALAPIPLLLTATLTSPFVNSITLHLPARARASRAALRRFAADPPPDALLDIRTVRLNGFWKTTGTALGELRALPPSGKGRWRRWGLANVERVPWLKSGGGGEKGGRRSTGGSGGGSGSGSRRRGLLQRVVGVFVEPRRRFYINAADGARRSAEPGVVELIMKAVEERSAGDGNAGPAQQQAGKR